MLIYFKVGNYKSIKEPVTINFNASSITEHGGSNIAQEKHASLLKSILLYGHNASGKSKILDAFAFFSWFVRNSAKENQSSERIDVNYFELSDLTEKKPSFFEIAFLVGNKKYRYGFEADEQIIHKEWLLETSIKKENPLFLRINNDFEIDLKRFQNADGLKKRTRKNALFLSVASQWNVKKAEEIDEWFGNLSFIHGLKENTYRIRTLAALKDEKTSKLIQAFMKAADLGINSVDALSMEVEKLLEQATDEDIKSEIKQRFVEKKETQFVVSLHSKYSNNNEKKTEVPFDFDMMESDGTIKYFNIAGAIVDSILKK